MFKLFWAVLLPVRQMLAQHVITLIGVAAIALGGMWWWSNLRGKAAVVQDVTIQANEIKAKDAAENLELIIDGIRIGQQIDLADRNFLRDVKEAQNETTKTLDDEAKRWADQPLPAGILERLRDAESQPDAGE